MVKHRLRLRPGHRLSRAESKLRETRDAARKKLEEIEKRVLEDPGKEEQAKQAAKGKGKSKEHLAVIAEGDPRKSLDSDRSDASGKTQNSKSKKSAGVVMGVLAAVEGKDFVTVDAPSKALTSPKNGKLSAGLHGRSDGYDSDEYDDDLEENAFNHPSTYQDQPWIWIPQWEAHPEISAQLIRDIKAGDVEASDLGAIIDDHGTVWVKRNPPDEDWNG
jgi:hypothetical protein